MRAPTVVEWGIAPHPHPRAAEGLIVFEREFRSAKREDLFERANATKLPAAGDERPAICLSSTDAMECQAD